MNQTQANTTLNHTFYYLLAHAAKIGPRFTQTKETLVSYQNAQDALDLVIEVGKKSEVSL